MEIAGIPQFSVLSIWSRRCWWTVHRDAALPETPM